MEVYNVALVITVYDKMALNLNYLDTYSVEQHLT